MSSSSKEQPTQSPKRPAWYQIPDGDAVYMKDETDPHFDSQDARIAELEKELSHTKWLLENAEAAIRVNRNTTSAGNQYLVKLEKELRVMRRALDMLDEDLPYIGAYTYIEVARKEQ